MVDKLQRLEEEKRLLSTEMQKSQELIRKLREENLQLKKKVFERTTRYGYRKTRDIDQIGETTLL